VSRACYPAGSTTAGDGRLARWQAAGRARSKSFITRALAGSYRAELVRAARQGLEFDPATGEPVRWAGPEPVTVTWYQHARSGRRR
jgi:hypothetical protein